MSLFWSLWIIVLTCVCTAAIVWLLLANRTTRGGPDVTTGHVYDGIEEYDNPLPAWWFYLFVGTVVFGIGYVIAYPALGSYRGALGWTQENQLEREVQRAGETYGPLFARYAALPIAEVARDPQALKMGQRLFAVHCAQCHGADARGSFAFPNLTDGDWLYGGAPEQIEQTIAHGRSGAMPAWEAVLGDTGMQQVTAYVVGLNGRPTDTALAAEGGKKFAMFCTACHGADGGGNTAFGAPNLTDSVWLYGGSPQMIQQTVRYGRTARMPPWQQRLGAERVHLLAAYVYSLSAAPTTPAAAAAQ